MGKNIASGLKLVFWPLILWGAVESHSGPSGQMKSDELSIQGAQARTDHLDVFFTASRQSEIKPCGCPQKKLGGVQFESTLYSQEADGGELRLDAGDWTIFGVQKDPAASMKTRRLLESFHLLGFDAVNISSNDAANRSGFFESISAKIPEVWDFLVSANLFLRSDPQKHAFKTHRIVERNLVGGRHVRIGVIGACLGQSVATGNSISKGPAADIEIGDFIIKSPAEHIESVLEMISPRVDLVILLFAGDNDSAVQLADRFATITYLITTAELTGEAQKHVFNNTRLLSTPFEQGKRLGKLALLRSNQGEWLPDEPAITLDVWAGLDPDPVLQDMIDNWTAITVGLELPRPEKPNLLYAGSYRCGLCHEAEAKDWKLTAHATALETLIGQGQQYNPECQKCHTTGFRHGNGFWGISDHDSRFFHGVQCESCHGPSKVHADAEQQIRSGAEKWMAPEDFERLVAKAKSNLPPVRVDKQSCTQCHDADNDAGFIYLDELKKIDHIAGN